MNKFLNIKSKAKVFFIACVFFVVGILVASFLPRNIANNEFNWFALFTLCTALIQLFFKKRAIRNVFIWFAFLFFAIFRYSIGIHDVGLGQIKHYNEKNVTIHGRVEVEIIAGPKNQSFKISSQKVRIESKNNFTNWANISGDVLVSADLYPVIKYGDELEVRCKLKAPEGLNDFAYDRFLAKSNIYSICNYPKIKIISRQNGRILYSWIYDIKSRVKDIINNNLGDPEAGLLRAIILGDKKGITSELRDSFSKSGISHVVAISGMHISIISALLMGVLIFFGAKRQVAFVVSSIFLSVYIILIGAPPSAIRAGVMGFLVLLALNIGRLNKIYYSLAFSAVLLLLINPRLLRDDIGFQLSFLAVTGIIVFYPIINNWFEIIIARLSTKYFYSKCIKGFLIMVGKIINVTMSAQIFVLPIIIYNFKVLSIVAPMTNVMVLWCLPILMILAIVAVIVSLILPILGIILFIVINLFLKYIILISALLIKLPFAYLLFDNIEAYWIFVYYFICICGLISSHYFYLFGKCVKLKV
ncbi:ComEC/Rec2 family competence protein [Patescibacteria group bacterium]|nr:ComEC/Rec2 family competence protein [Patescibacteria group bacterium]